MLSKHASDLGKMKASMAFVHAIEESQNPKAAEEKRAKKPLSEAWKEGCRLMRCFIFGAVGNESAQSEEEKNAIYHESLGTKEMVGDLYAVWSELDSDHSGRVDLPEFRCFAEQREKKKNAGNSSPLRQSLPSERGSADTARFIQKLCERLEKLLLAKKSSFAIEDGSQTLHIDEMVKQELIRSEEEKHEWFKVSGKQEVNALEFCEMMCPAGFRASAQSTSGTLPDGRRVVLDARLACWRLADSYNDILEQPDLT